MDTRLAATTLIAACQHNNAEKIKELLQSESPVDKPDDAGRVPLHYAAESCDVEIVRLIHQADPSLVNRRDQDGFTPLNVAMFNTNLNVVDYLLKNNADINNIDREKHSLVHWAIVCGSQKGLEVLINRGALFDTADVYGAHPLHYATQIFSDDDTESLGMLHTLLKQNNINTNCRDLDERAPLHWAASSGSWAAVEALAERGADLNAADKDYLTALHCAASRGYHQLIQRFLDLSSAIVIDAKDRNGSTPLFYAVTLGHAECVQVLLQRGANAFAQDKKGRTSAHCGAACGQLRSMQALHQFENVLDVQNHRGDLPLHEAAQSGAKNVLEWILDVNPGSVDASNSFGRTALHIAAACGSLELVGVLVQRGADVNAIMLSPAQDKHADTVVTPLDLALIQHHDEVAEFLAQNGGRRATALDSNYLNTMKDRIRAREHETLRQAHTAVSQAPTDELIIQPPTEESKFRLVYEEQRQTVNLDDFETQSSKSNALPVKRGKKPKENKHSHSSRHQNSTSSVQDLPTDNDQLRILPLSPKRTEKVALLEENTFPDGLANLGDVLSYRSTTKNNEAHNRRQLDNGLMGVTKSKLRNDVPAVIPGTERSENMLTLPQISARSTQQHTRLTRSKVHHYLEEKRIFQELANLKRMQVQYGKVQENVLVNRLSNEFLKAYPISPGEFQFDTFNAWEKFLYDQLKCLYLLEQDELSQLTNRTTQSNATKTGHRSRRKSDAKLRRLPPLRDEQRIDQLAKTYGVAPLPFQYSPAL